MNSHITYKNFLNNILSCLQIKGSIRSGFFNAGAADTCLSCAARWTFSFIPGLAGYLARYLQHAPSPTAVTTTDVSALRSSI